MEDAIYKYLGSDALNWSLRPGIMDKHRLAKVDNVTNGKENLCKLNDTLSHVMARNRPSPAVPEKICVTHNCRMEYVLTLHTTNGNASSLTQAC